VISSVIGELTILTGDKVRHFFEILKLPIRCSRMADRESSSPPGISLAFTKRSFTEITTDSRQLIFRVENVESLDFSINAISSIPQDLLELPTLKKLTMFNNRISVVSSDTTSILTLDLGSNNLTRMPLGFPELLSLNADWNSIEAIDFAYSKVSRLCLSSNLIRFIAPGLVFSELRVLDISRNALQELPNLILFCPLLVRLKASRNEIRTFPVFSETLRFLDLSWNQISVIPEDIIESKLVQLDLSFNSVEILPEMPVSLRSLMLEGNALSAVAILSSPILSELSFSRNRLTSFPVILSRKLQELKLDHNHFEALEVSECSQLISKIDLSFNSIVEVPFELFTLPNLTSLDLSFNRIERLPEGISGPSLLSLNISGNPLQALPPQLPGTLEQLIACSCGLTVIPDSYVELPELIDLDLSLNFIKVVPKFQHLQRLRFASNSLSVFPSVSLAKLQYLDLALNQIQMVPAITACPRLQFIDLSCNRISWLERLECPILSSLRLTANPIAIPFIPRFRLLKKLRFIEVSNTQLNLDQGWKGCIASWVCPAEIGYAQLRGQLSICEDILIVKTVGETRIFGFFHADEQAFVSANAFTGEQSELKSLEFADNGQSGLVFLRDRSLIGYVRGDVKFLIVKETGDMAVD
jgi:Leucine-rich repeat (LRR) protein